MPTPHEDTQVRPFADFLREQARGRSHDELSVGLLELVKKVKDTGKRGTITYTVSVEPTKGVTGALTVKDEIKVRLPEHDRPASLFFADRQGNLRKDDPDQLTFESLREVPDPTTHEGLTITVLDTATGELRELPQNGLAEALAPFKARPEPTTQPPAPQRATAAAEGR